MNTLAGKHLELTRFAGRTSRPRVLAALAKPEVNDFLPEPLLGELRGLAREFVVVDTQEVKGPAWEKALAGFDPDLLVACWRTDPLPAVLPPSLRYVCYLGGSVRRLVSRRHLEQGLVVTNWGDAVSRTVAEGALMLVLMCLRRAGEWNTRLHRDRAWVNGTLADTQSLFGRSVGLHGFGNVARHLVELLRPFRVPVCAYDPYVADATFARLRVTRVDTLGELFAGREVVVELAGLSEETRGSVGRELLEAMPAGATFVNVGRGAIVDEAALHAVALSGRLTFGLDVFHREPLPVDSPLRGLPNVVLLPHIAGPTPDRRVDAGAVALANLRRYVAGEPLESVITPESFDRTT